MLRITTKDTPDQIREAFGLEDPADKSGDPTGKGAGDSPDSVRMQLERPKDGKGAGEKKVEAKADNKADDQKADDADEKAAADKKAADEKAAADAKAEKKAKGARRFDSQARIEDLSNKNRTLASERDSALSEAAKAKEELEALKTGKGAKGDSAKDDTAGKDAKAGESDDPDAKPLARPKLDDFQNEDNPYEAWQNAKDDWILAEQRRERRLERKQETKLRSENAVADSRRMDQARAFHQRLEAVADVLPDYDKVVASGKNLPTSEPFREAVMESEFGPQLVYHYAKNPDDYKALVKQSPMQIAKTLAKLEATFEADAEAAGDAGDGDKAGDAGKGDEKAGDEKAGERGVQARAAVPRASKPIEPTRGGNGKTYSASENPEDDPTASPKQIRDWYNKFKAPQMRRRMGM